MDQQLMDYFKFDQADLEANRAGQFSEKQRARIFKEDTSDRSGSRIFGGVLLFIGAIGFCGALFAIINDPDWGFRIGFGLSFGVLWPLIWGGLGWMIMMNSFSKHEFILASVQGPANIVRGERTGSDHTTHIYHELHIGGQEFNVEANLADVMMQGNQYILYYIKDSSEILSAEEVAS